MDPLLEDKPLAVDVLREWLESCGFSPMQKEVGGDGYFVKGASISQSHWPSDDWKRAAILYRGGGLPKIKAKLRAVAEVLDHLGVEYGVEENRYGYLFLMVTLSEALNAGQEGDELGASPVP